MVKNIGIYARDNRMVIIELVIKFNPVDSIIYQAVYRGANIIKMSIGMQDDVVYKYLNKSGTHLGKLWDHVESTFMIRAFNFKTKDDYINVQISYIFKIKQSCITLKKVWKSYQYMYKSL